MSAEKSSEDSPNKSRNRRRRLLAAGSAAAALAIGFAPVVAGSLGHSNESVAVSHDQQKRLRFAEDLKFFGFLDGLKPGVLTDSVPSHVKRVVTLRDGDMAINPISPVKVDVASQIVYATQDLLAATGGNPQNAHALMRLYSSLTTPETRDLLASEGIHVTIARPSNNSIGASGVDERQGPDGHNIYNAEFITPKYGDDSGSGIVWPAGPTPRSMQEHFSHQLAEFQQQLSPRA